LQSSYRFYRALIDALRVVRGHAKDLVVPSLGSDEYTRLARRLRRPETERFQDELEETLRAVSRLWDDAERELRQP
jgi:glutamate-ammonia-ligase adenylyltransferase